MSESHHEIRVVLRKGNMGDPLAFLSLESYLRHKDAEPQRMNMCYRFDRLVELLASVEEIWLLRSD